MASLHSWVESVLALLRERDRDYRRILGYYEEEIGRCSCGMEDEPESYEACDACAYQTRCEEERAIWTDNPRRRYRVVGCATCLGCAEVDNDY